MAEGGVSGGPFNCGLPWVAASVPWIPVPPVNNLAQGPELYEQMAEVGAAKTALKLGIHEAFAKSFPFYLAGRYHRMDAVKIHQLSLSDRSYWASIGHYLRAVTDFATIPYYNLRMISRMERGVKPGYEFCKTPEEFLLEPWILMQLPFQPALLHQWAVAALAETLRYCKRLVEIGTVGYLPQFHDLYSKMAELSKTLYKNCHVFLAYFFNIYCKDLEETINTKAKKINAEFPQLLAETLAGLEFVLGKDCSKILESMKLKSWAKNISPKDLKFSTDSSEIGCFDPKLEPTANVYSDVYWRSTPATAALCLKVTETVPRALINAAEAQTFATRYYPDMLKASQESLKRIKAFTKNKISKDGLLMLKGMSGTEGFVGDLEKFMTAEELEIFRQELLVILFLRGRHSKSPVQGILNQILCLQADVFIEHSLGTLMRLIWRAAKRFDPNVYVNNTNVTRTEEIPIKSMMEKINGVKSQKANWKTKSIFEKAWTTCVPENNIIEVDGVASAVFLSIEIRKNVLDMHKKHYTSLKTGPFQYFPECLFYQYVMPCFAAMLMDVGKHYTLMDPIQTKYYMFLHQMIKAYKGSEYVQELGVYKKRPFYSCDTVNGASIKMEGLLAAFTSVFQESTKMQSIITKLGHLAENAIVIVPKNHPNPELFVPIDSDIQTCMLVARLVLGTTFVGWFKPEIIGVEKTSGFLNTMKFLKNCSSDIDNILTVDELKSRNIQDEVFEELFTDQKFKTSLRDSKSLTKYQLTGIMRYEVMRLKLDKEKLFSAYQGPLFEYDVNNLTAKLILSGNWFDIKIHFNEVERKENSEDRKLIPLDLAKKTVCCRPLINAISAAGKIKLDHPGQVTYFPIQHCRWCGLVYCEKFRLCPECEEDPEFFDPTYFCSEKCETECLDECHREEHAKFVMVSMGIIRSDE